MSSRKPYRVKDPEQRFWRQIEIVPCVSPFASGNCWNWTGRQVKGRYGHFDVHGKDTYVHRYSYELMVGPIPSGITTTLANGKEKCLTVCVLHRCDNMICCNPAHLFLGTRIDNAIDRDTKGRARKQYKTYCKRGHLYEGDNVYHYGNGKRACKACWLVRYHNNKNKKGKL